MVIVASVQRAVPLVTVLVALYTSELAAALGLYDARPRRAKSRWPSQWNDVANLRARRHHSRRPGQRKTRDRGRKGRRISTCTPCTRSSNQLPPHSSQCRIPVRKNSVDLSGTRYEWWWCVLVLLLAVINRDHDGRGRYNTNVFCHCKPSCHVALCIPLRAKQRRPIATPFKPRDSWLLADPICLSKVGALIWRA